MTSLAHQLLGQTRSAVLSALLLHPDSSLHVRELARLTGASAGSLHRELRLLANLGLLLRHEAGRQVHYRANTAHPVYAELSQFLRKTAGLVDVLRQALEPIFARIDLAFVYGSMASGGERAGSDVDLMVLGDVGFADVVRETAAVQSLLRREVNPVVMSAREFAGRVNKKDGFALSVMKGDKLWLKGGDRDFAELAQNRSAKAAPSYRRRGATAAGRHRAQSR